MELYIAKKNESLYEIAAQFNLSFEELVQFNRTYRFRKDLEDCPVLIPEHKRLEERAKVFVPHKDPDGLSMPMSLVEKYNFQLKELIMASFYIEGYVGVLAMKLESTEEKIRKYLAKKKTTDVTKISEAMGFKGIARTVREFISALKNHQIEDVKNELRNLKKWPSKIALLYSSDVNRDDERKKLLSDIVNLWRDYILSLATAEFEQAEKHFEKIEAASRDAAKVLFD